VDQHFALIAALTQLVEDPLYAASVMVGFGERMIGSAEYSSASAPTQQEFVWLVVCLTK
jgi:hypothetical protein